MEQRSRRKLKKTSKKNFEVEEILDSKQEDDGLSFKIRWKGFGSSEDTWEPFDNLKGTCDSLIDKYWKTHPAQKSVIDSKNVDKQTDENQTANNENVVNNSQNDNNNDSSNRQQKTFGLRRNMNNDDNEKPNDNTNNESKDAKEDSSVILEISEQQTPTKSNLKHSTRSRRKRVSNEKKANNTKNANDTNDEIIEDKIHEISSDKDDDENNEFEVEFIENHRKTVSRPKLAENGDICHDYYVKWRGWTDEYNTWEHENNLLPNCKESILTYWRTKPKTKSDSKRKTRRQRDENTEDNKRKMEFDSMESSPPPKKQRVEVTNEKLNAILEKVNNASLQEISTHLTEIVNSNSDEKKRSFIIAFEDFHTQVKN